MKKVLFGVVVLIILLAGYFFFFNNESLKEADSVYAQFTDSSIELQFEYKTEPDGYVIDDLSALIGEQPEGVEVIKVFRVMNEREKIDLETSEGGREGPPVITLMVFKNLQNQSVSQWVDAFPFYSAIGMAIGDVNRDAVVGGADAVKYRADGLYQSDYVVIAHGGYIYLFNGAFLEENSTIHQDFGKLVDSVLFIPENEINAKIDVRVACESALAYMLFETGEDADAFVEECVNGGHPDVIDRYIKDLGIDGASI